MFDAMSSLTGGGGLNSSSSSSADGDNGFSNSFDYKSNSGGQGDKYTLAIVGIVAFATGFLLAKAVK